MLSSVISPSKITNQYLFRWFLGLVSLAIVLSVLLENYLPFVIPIIAIGLGLLWNDYRKLFYFIFMVLPFSVEMYFEGAGLGTDLPSEPLMIFLCGLTILYLLSQDVVVKKSYIFHIVTFFFMSACLLDFHHSHQF